jgi:hypothetical protein
VTEELWVVGKLFDSPGDKAPTGYCVERANETLCTVDESKKDPEWRYTKFTKEQAEMVANFLNIDIVKSAIKSKEN